MRQPYLNPAVVCPLLWLSVTIGANVSGIEFYPLSASFFLYMTTAVGVFSLSALMSQTAARHLGIFGAFYTRLAALRIPLTGRAIIRLHLTLMLFSLVFQCLDHALIAGSTWWQPIGLIVYRLSVSEFGIASNFRFTAILNYFFFSLAPLLWIYWRDVSRILRGSCLACLAFFVYLSTSRASFFTIILLAMLFVLHFRPRIQLAATVGLLLFFAFQLLGSLIGKNSSSAFWIYLYAPSYALDQIIQGIRTDIPGAMYTFYPVQPFLSRLGFIAARQSNNLSYYSTPFRTNVYTMFGTFILDFGVYGSVVWMAVIGYTSGVLRGLQRRRPDVPYLGFLSSLSITVLLLGVFHDYYTTAGYVWFTLFFATLFFPREFPAGRLQEPRSPVARPRKRALGAVVPGMS